MKPPQLDRQVTVEQKSVTQDATYGTDVVTWEPLAVLPGSPVVAEKFWAEVTDMTGREASEQGLAMSRGPKKVTIRYRADIDSSMRVIVHGDVDEVCQITAPPIEIGGRKQWLQLLCERISS